MLGKLFRGVFGQPQDLPEQFRGAPFDVLDTFSEWDGIELVKVSEEVRELRYGGNVVTVTQDVQSGHLLFQAPVSRATTELGADEDFDMFFSLLKIGGDQVYIQRSVLCWHHGDPMDVVRKAVGHLKLVVFGQKGGRAPGHFRPYLNGRTFLISWKAFASFMADIKRDRVTSEASNYISFDTGGLPLGLQKVDNSQEIIISYDLRDYEGIYSQHRAAILELINGVALRHRDICFLIGEERLLIVNKFYVSPETDAVNLYTAQLQAIHDALLDYLMTVKEDPSTAWLRAARAAYLKQNGLPPDPR